MAYDIHILSWMMDGKQNEFAYPISQLIEFILVVMDFITYMVSLFSRHPYMLFSIYYLFKSTIKYYTNVNNIHGHLYVLRL